jgi:multiple sugar transport system permease protein
MPDEEQIQKTLLAAASAGIVLSCLAPAVYMVLTALSGRPDFLSAGQRITLTLDHFGAVLGSESLHFLAFLRNSILISALSAVLSVSIAAAAAYALTRFTFAGRRTLLLTVLALSMFPQISLVSYLFKLMTAVGWINTYAALVFPYTAWTLPLCLWILVSYFAQLPGDLDRAGLIDGCSRLQILVRIILPVAAPGLFSTLLLAVIFCFNEFLFALMLTTDHAARTVPVGLALFEGLHGRLPWGEIMAAATVATVPVVLLTLVFQRRIVQGLTRGALKE